MLKKIAILFFFFARMVSSEAPALLRYGTRPSSRGTVRFHTDTGYPRARVQLGTGPPAVARDKAFLSGEYTVERAGCACMEEHGQLLIT
jgi:hypothetical protein